MKESGVVQSEIDLNDGLIRIGGGGGGRGGLKLQHDLQIGCPILLTFKAVKFKMIRNM